MAKPLILFLAFLVFLSFPTKLLQAAPQKQDSVPVTGNPVLAEASQLNGQVLQLFKEKKFNEALPLAQKVLELREKAVGPDHQLVADALYNLGAIWVGRASINNMPAFLETARQTYQRWIKLTGKLAGNDNPKICAGLEQLGWLEATAQNKSKAEECFTRSLEIRARAFGAESSQAADGLHQLALFFQYAGDYPQAVTIFRKEIGLREKSLGPTHRRVGELLEECSCALEQNRQPEESAALSAQARLILDPEENSDPSLETAEIIRGKALHRESPGYPSAAKSQRVSGTVVCQIIIDEKGTVTSVKTKCGHPLLKGEAERACWKWKFKPTLINGTPVKVTGLLSFAFTL